MLFRSPPIVANMSAPAITGTWQVGTALNASTGTWNPSTGLSYSYQWMSAATAGGTYTNVANGTAATYSLVAADLGRYFKVVVTASASGYQNGTATSVASPLIVAGTLTSATPLIVGTGVVGETLTVNAGTWTPSPTFTYQWVRSDTATGSFTPIAGATGASYVVTAADAGMFLEVIVTGTVDGYLPKSETSTATAIAV